MPAPVYIRSNKRFAVDEVCVCGHLKSKHGSQLRGYVRFPHEGSCCEESRLCKCRKFVWAGWHYAEAAT